MRTLSQPAPNVVRFPGPRSGSSSRRDQKSLMDTIYTMGSLCVPADDRDTKAMAARLQVFGFLVIEEVQADGSTRALRASETMHAATERPWLLSKPSLGAA
jgi:hypothetical protein